MIGGYEQAIETFFVAYLALVYRFTLPRLNRDVEASREVVQTAFATARWRGANGTPSIHLHLEQRLPLRSESAKKAEPLASRDRESRYRKRFATPAVAVEVLSSVH
jgi:hypothetical protein